MGFSVALGETSTPSLLGTPGNTNPLAIEYASLSLLPLAGLTAEAGLLQPNAGYESAYTYNKNTFLGAVTSQQPFNAYGARAGYAIREIRLCAGYYRERLDDEEYVTDESKPNESWELGLSSTWMETDVGLYYYHVESQRSLTGGFIQPTVAGIGFAMNVDYWTWDSAMRDVHEDDGAIGAAVYVVPRFGKFSLPVRLEYVDQGKSAIYLISTEARQIYAATLSPTYHFRENAYIRADLGYVGADDGFNDNNGHPQDDRICLAAELGYSL